MEACGQLSALDSSTVDLLEGSQIRSGRYGDERNVQSVPGGQDNILGGHSIGDYKQTVYTYVYVSYSERFSRYTYLTVRFQNCS
jgi:hypothetical protein